MGLKQEKKYLSDMIGEAYKNWDTGFVILDAGTGAGKTTFCLSILAVYAKEQQKTVLYLTNRDKLREKIQKTKRKLSLDHSVRIMV